MKSGTVVCAVAGIASLTLNLAGCSVTAPIESATTSKSAFDGAVYKGETVTVNAGSPGEPTFRVFQQGRSLYQKNEI